MAAFHMQCSCGHDIKVEAKSRTDAVSKIKGLLDEKAIEEHLKTRHKGEPAPSVAQVHLMVAQNTMPA